MSIYYDHKKHGATDVQRGILADGRAIPCPVCEGYTDTTNEVGCLCTFCNGAGTIRGQELQDVAKYTRDIFIEKIRRVSEHISRHPNDHKAVMALLYYASSYYTPWKHLELWRTAKAIHTYELGKALAKHEKQEEDFEFWKETNTPTVGSYPPKDPKGDSFRVDSRYRVSLVEYPEIPPDT